MKKISQFLTTAILLILASANLTIEAKIKKICWGQAKINCNGSCEWRHGKCRNKVKKSAQNLQSNDTRENNSAKQTLQIQIFTPVDQYGGPDFQGKIMNDGSATISDPTGLDSEIYSFFNVVSQDPTLQGPANAQWLGIITNTSMCPTTGCIEPRILNVFGFPDAQNPAIVSQAFTINPAMQFSGQNLIGYYYNDGTLKIQSGNNQTPYNFINVVSQAANLPAPDGLTLLGSTQNIQVAYCSNCPTSSRMTNFYGNIIPK